MSAGPFPYHDEPQDKVMVFSEGDVPFGVFHSYTWYTIHLDRREYPTVEHYYQAMKFSNTGISEQIRLAPTPGAAVQMAHNKADGVRDDWDDVKYDYIERAMYTKFTQHPELHDLLLATGHAKLVEKRAHHDKMDRISSQMLCEVLHKVRQQLFVNAITKVRQHACQLPLRRLSVCPKGRDCPQINDELHSAYYSHPCPRAKNCTNPSPWHLHQFLHIDDLKRHHADEYLQMPTADHILKLTTTNETSALQGGEAGQPPVCSFHIDCKLLNIPGHAGKFLHLCPNGTVCKDFALSHRRQWLHADALPEPCSDGLSCVFSDDVSHIMKFSHPCPAGVKCMKMTPAHLECYSHVIPPCPAGTRCWRLKFKDHNQEFSHPCSRGLGCTKQGHLQHARMWTHDVMLCGRPVTDTTPTLPPLQAAPEDSNKAAN